MVEVTEINYKNFGRCLILENKKASMIITVDIGPRIISYCLNGKENMLFEDINRDFRDSGKKLRGYFGWNETWYIYGGHRLWSSPESHPHSYVPDNAQVEYEIRDMGVSLFPQETRTGQRHEWTVTMDDNSAVAAISHKLINTSGAIVTMAPWALTVCAPGGVEIFPQDTSDKGLLSNRRCVFWSYSDIHDERFFLGNKYGTLRQIPRAETKFKIGMNNTSGWAAIVNNGQIFIKSFDMTGTEDDYPDGGCNFETFTNGLFLECESLGILSQMPNGSSAGLSEKWNLVPCDETFDPRDEESIDAFAKKYILPNIPR